MKVNPNLRFYDSFPLYSRKINNCEPFENNLKDIYERLVTI